jgi:hypothetical protein
MITKSQRVYDFLLTHPDRTIAEIAAAVGITEEEAENAVTTLMHRWGAIEPFRRRYRLSPDAIRPNGWGGRRRGSGRKIKSDEMPTNVKPEGA